MIGISTKICWNCENVGHNFKYWHF